MAYDFPSKPSEGQKFTPPGGPVYTFTRGVWKGEIVVQPPRPTA